MPPGLVDAWGSPIPGPKGGKGLKFGRNQKIALWAVVATLLGAAAIPVVSYWEMKKTRSAYPGPWLRFEYFVCTGPYNNSLIALEHLPLWVRLGSTNDNLQHSATEFVVRNAVYDEIKEMEPEGDKNYNRNSQVTTVWLKESLLDAITGFRSQVRPRGGSNVRRSSSDISEKLRYYFEYLRINRLTVRSLHAVGATPPWVNALPSNDTIYNEPVDVTIARSPHSDEIVGTAYFRSVRTVHLRIENVSPYNLTRLHIHLSDFAGVGTRLAALRKSAVQPVDSQFPIDVLKPGEAVVYPLSISLIPHLEASSLLMGSAERVKEYWRDDSFDESAQTVMILSSVGQQTLRVSPSFMLDHVSFHVEDEDQQRSETRAMATKDLLQVSQTCECGSCPLLLMRSRKGKWIRARELLSRANARAKEGTFEVNIPFGIDEIMIAENPGETTLLRYLTVTEKRSDGVSRTHDVLFQRSANVAYSVPMHLDLRPFHQPGSQLTLSGAGY
jgi:hypothetical protein